MRADEDPCEECGVSPGDKVFEGLYVCHKCAKKLRKQARRNKDINKEEEDE